MFRMKQAMKMLLQNVLLPLLYRLYCRRPVERGLVLFADAHHEGMPFSMSRMYDAVEGMTGDFRIENFVTDFDALSFLALARYLVCFMRRYAVAEYVFVCDYFLPVASCAKRPETKVVQLWHSCGLMKKIAYDTGEDIPKGYHGSMFDNYSYLTLSAPACIPVHERALRLKREHIFATGVSRTDFYFDESWNHRCQENFKRKHPEAAGKKVAVWAPTFRGNAAAPRLEGLEAVRKAAEDLNDEWCFLIKAHPHVDRHERISNSSIPTEELLPVADVLITDYSSVLFDYLLFQKPVVLFAPDLEEYDQRRGFYIDYRSIPFPLTRTGEELEEELRSVRQGTRDAKHAKMNLPDISREGEVTPLDVRAEGGVNPPDIRAEGEVNPSDVRVEDKVNPSNPIAEGGVSPSDAGEKAGMNVAVEMQAGTGQDQRKRQAVHWLAADWYEAHGQEIDAFCKTYVGACDGKATERILRLVGLVREE